MSQKLVSPGVLNVRMRIFKQTPYSMPIRHMAELLFNYIYVY